MPIQLNLTKPDEKPAHIQLPLQKVASGAIEQFTVKLAWEGQVDLDSHALLTYNSGIRSTLPGEEAVLSTYIFKRDIGGGQIVGMFDRNPDQSFEIYGGALHHSKDVLDGDQADVDEVITIRPSLMPKAPAGSAIEIPIFAMIDVKYAEKGMTFGQVKNAWLSIENSAGVEIERIILSTQFDSFTGVQAGALMIDDQGVNFVLVGVGINGDFNTVLANY